jgi:hypothetical protein
MKTHRQKTPKVKPTARGSSAASLQKQLDQRTRELAEALAQQAATSEVLRAISHSPAEAASALQAIAESAARLLDVTDAEIMRVEGDVVRCVAKYGPSQLWPVGSTRPLNRDWVTGRAIVDRTSVHVPDLQAAASEFSQGAAYAREYGIERRSPFLCCAKNRRLERS